MKINPKIKFTLKVAGIILIFWVGTITAANAMLKFRVPVSLPTGVTVLAYDDYYASAEGTWIIEGDKMAAPLQTTKIVCYRPKNSCTSATAEVWGDHLSVNLEFFEIAQWNYGSVVFVNNSPSCVSYIYTINTLTKTASGIRKKKEKFPTGLGCEEMKDEMRLSLKEGFSVWWELQESELPWFGKLAIAPLKVFN